MSLTAKTDLVDEALGKLLGVLKDKANIEALVSALAQQIQDAEDAAQSILTQDTIDNAEGDQLDVWGEVVGQEREGRTDAEYRPWIKARMLLNRASGTPEEILAIIGFVLPDGATLTEVVEYAPANFVLRIADLADADAAPIATLISRAKAVGVKGIMEWWNDDAHTFSFSDTYPDSDNDTGFGDDTNLTIGGYWAESSEE